MELILKETPTKRAEKLLEVAKKSKSFKTGVPEKVLSYMLKENKVVFVSFQTSGGIEECINGNTHSCLADAQMDADKEVRFK